MTVSFVNSFGLGGGFDVQIDALSGGGLVLRGLGSQAHLSTLDDANVRTVIAGQNVSAPLHGSIQQLTNGNYVLFAQTHTGLGRGVDIQIFSATGTALTGVIQPMSEQNGDALSGTGFSVTPTDGGGFALTWTSDAAAGTQIPATDLFNTSTLSEAQDVRIRYFDANGVAVAPSLIASDDPYNNNGPSTLYHAATQFIYDSETLTGGGVVYAYHTQTLVGQTAGFSHLQNQITVQVSSGAADPGTPVKVDQNPFYTGNDGGFAGFNTISGFANTNVVALPDGTFAIVWQEQSYVAAPVFGGKAFDGTDSFIRYFAADGTPTSDAIEFLHRGTDMGNINKYVWAEALPDGRIAVAYHDGIDGFNGTGRADAYLGVIDSGVLGDVIRVNTSPANPGQSFSIFDLAVQSNGLIALEYNDATLQPNNFNLNHTTIARFAVEPVNPPGPSVIHDQVGNTALLGTEESDLFIFDNQAGTGRDTITQFAADDLLLTTVKIFDSNDDGIVSFGSDKRADLFGNGSDDVAIKTDGGKTLTKLAYEGVLTVDGIDYFAYGVVGQAGAAAYQQHLGVVDTFLA